MRLDDPDVVATEYASDERLAARIAAYRFSEGPDPRELAFRAVAEVAPRSVLEVGSGRGELADRIARELDADVTAVDQSERMVELTAARGIDARLGDVLDLDFPDSSFDCAVAAWMLYHVLDVDRALGELARVLRPGGRLVAVTNGSDHWRELYELLGVPRLETTFPAEAAPELLGRWFERVETREARGWIVFPSRAETQEFVDATISLARAERPIPEFDGSLRVRRSPVVFVTDKT